MNSTIKHKVTKKKLYLKKDCSLHFAYKNSKKPSPRRSLGLLEALSFDRLKVQKVKAIKGGSTLYNTSLRD